MTPSTPSIDEHTGARAPAKGARLVAASSVWLIALALITPLPDALGAPTTSCHIHPLADVAAGEDGSIQTGEQPAIVGPFADHVLCEEARRRRFGASGRCHCSSRFSPAWTSPRTYGRPDGKAASGSVPTETLP
jgi:hypothetical protein